MKKYIKRIIGTFLFMTLVIECGKFFRYILIDDTSSSARITFHEMYEQENIDVLFVGSSHCQRTFIPEILDKEMWGGVNTFNVGTSSQHLDASYMIIKEAAKRNNIKHIYLEIYYVLSSVVYKDRSDLTQTYIVADYLKPSFDKICFLLNASTKDYYSNSFILARRNWSDFFDADYIKDIIAKKGSDTYKNYGYLPEYAGKGYIINNEVIENWNYFFDTERNHVDINHISKDWVYTLKDIIKFCKEQQIELTLVSAPMSNFLLIASGNYDDYVKFVRGIIADTNVDYYDFNLCKETYIPNSSSIFSDTNHLNYDGAKIFNYVFADLVNDKISEEELFYNSYEEKIKNLEPMVFGISYCDNYHENGASIRNCEIISNANNNLQYKIIAVPENGSAYVIQDFSDNKFFEMKADEYGTITVSYRRSDSTDEIDTVNISY